MHQTPGKNALLYYALCEGRYQIWHEDLLRSLARNCSRKWRIQITDCAPAQDVQN